MLVFLFFLGKCELSFCMADTNMPQTWVIIGGSVLLPNVGGFLGGFITRSQIKDWFDKGK